MTDDLRKRAEEVSTKLMQIQLEAGTMYGIGKKAEAVIEGVLRTLQAETRERDAVIADNHACGSEDDVMCRGQNCGLFIGTAIRQQGKEG